MSARPPIPVRNESGLALVFTLILMAGLLFLTVAGLISATSDLRRSRNYTTGLQALLAAEAGVLHAQYEITNSGVIRFQNDVVNQWSSLFGTSARDVAGTPKTTYSVAAAGDPTLPMSRMTLVSTGNAPDEAERRIEAKLALDGAYSPGAIYLPATGVSTTFNGNNFLVDGNDTNLDGTAAGEAVPGVAVADEPTAAAVQGTLTSGHEDNVIGLGGNESIFASNGPSVGAISADLIPGLLAGPTVVTDPRVTGNSVIGTVAVPQITYFSGDLVIGGTVDGAGIMIVDGGLRVTGNFNFTGLILVRGTTEITSLSGNSTILGAIWTTDLTLNVSGSASVTYSSEALQLANGIGIGSQLPQKVRLIAWREL